MPGFPFLVVIKTTPFAALEPYNEVEAASFNTEISSISSGFKALIFPVIGKPSITYRGSLPADTDTCPRIRTDIPCPGLPVV